MAERDTLTWTEVGRSALKSATHIRPWLRAGVALIRARESARDSLGRALERTASRHPDQIAIKHEGAPVTYAELNAWANRLAHWFLQRGLQRGQAVAVFIENRPALLAVVAAVAKAGAISALINTNQRRHVLLHSLRTGTPALYVVGEELVSAFEEVRSELGEIPPQSLLFVPDQTQSEPPPGYVDASAAIAALPAFNPPSTANICMGDPCFYIFTSGTTGLPKAARMSHERWLKASAVFGKGCLNIQPGDTLYVPLPLYHNQALTVGWSSVLPHGGAIAIRRKFSASAFWEDCRRHNAIGFVYIGEVTRYLLNRPASELDRAHRARKMVGGGLRADIWMRFKERFGIEEVYEFYGASEMNIAFLNAFNLNRTVGFCPIPWALVKYDVDAGEPVRDARGRLMRARKGEVGLVLAKVSDRFRFEGYTDREAGERKLFRDVFRKGDVWFNTGDLLRHIGFGHLQFVDRVGDTFRWKSENVSTTEVEEVLHAHEQVAECTVYGVEVPHAVGRAGMAAIVPKDKPEAFDLQAFLAYARRMLPGYAVPVFVRIAGALEVTGTYKHSKAALRRDGYDVRTIKDAIYVLRPGQDSYERLTEELYAAIMSGSCPL